MIRMENLSYSDSKQKNASNNNMTESSTKVIDLNDLSNIDNSNLTFAKDSSAFNLKGLKESLDSDLESVGKDGKKSSQRFLAKSSAELESMGLKELRALAESLADTVKDVSSELVHLLQENDMLQQTSDARNIVIEQLLQLTVNQSEAELRPIQMSVVIPSSNDDDWD